MSEYEYGHPSQHTGLMDDQHVHHFHRTGELQMPLFDVQDFDRTWKTTDSWADLRAELDEFRGEPV